MESKYIGIKKYMGGFQPGPGPHTSQFGNQVNNTAAYFSKGEGLTAAEMNVGQIGNNRFQDAAGQTWKADRKNGGFKRRTGGFLGLGGQVEHQQRLAYSKGRRGTGDTREYMGGLSAAGGIMGGVGGLASLYGGLAGNEKAGKIGQVLGSFGSATSTIGGAAGKAPATAPDTPPPATIPKQEDPIMIDDATHQKNIQQRRDIISDDELYGTGNDDPELQISPAQKAKMHQEGVARMGFRYGRNGSAGLMAKYGCYMKPKKK